MNLTLTLILNHTITLKRDDNLDQPQLCICTVLSNINRKLTLKFGFTIHHTKAEPHFILLTTSTGHMLDVLNYLCFA